MMRSISVIIPNYNGKHLFEKYFEHNFNVIKNSIEDVEIIVVDDASLDDSVSFLKDKYKNQITIIEKDKNTGFSDTCNKGIEQASKELIFLLNTDVHLTSSYFDKLFCYFDKADTFGVMGRIIGMNDDFIQDAARMPELYGKKIRIKSSYYVEDDNFFTPTIFLAGSAVLVNTKKIKLIGGFNSLFSPFYGEDFELCLRAWRMGWKCYYEHDAVCRHEISGTTKDYKKRNWVKFIYFRNRYFAHFLHLDGLDLLKWNIQIFIFDFLLSVLMLKFYKVKAYVSYLSNLNLLVQSKKHFTFLMKKQSGKSINLGLVINNIEKMTKNKKIIKV